MCPLRRKLEQTIPDTRMEKTSSKITNSEEFYMSLAQIPIPQIYPPFYHCYEIQNFLFDVVSEMIFLFHEIVTVPWIGIQHNTKIFGGNQSLNMR